MIITHADDSHVSKGKAFSGVRDSVCLSAQEA